jgi:hypothetical protein
MMKTGNLLVSCHRMSPKILMSGRKKVGVESGLIMRPGQIHHLGNAEITDIRKKIGGREVNVRATPDTIVLGPGLVLITVGAMTMQMSPAILVDATNRLVQVY